MKNTFGRRKEWMAAIGSLIIFTVSVVILFRASIGSEEAMFIYSVLCLGPWVVAPIFFAIRYFSGRELDRQALDSLNQERKAKWQDFLDSKQRD